MKETRQILTRALGIMLVVGIMANIVTAQVGDFGLNGCKWEALRSGYVLYWPSGGGTAIYYVDAATGKANFKWASDSGNQDDSWQFDPDDNPGHFRDVMDDLDNNKPPNRPPSAVPYEPGGSAKPFTVHAVRKKIKSGKLKALSENQQTAVVKSIRKGTRIARPR